MWTLGNGRVYMLKGQTSQISALVSESSLRPMRAHFCHSRPTCGAFRWSLKTAKTTDPQESVPETRGSPLSLATVSGQTIVPKWVPISFLPSLTVSSFQPKHR